MEESKPGAVPAAGAAVTVEDVVSCCDKLLTFGPHLSKPVGKLFAGLYWGASYERPALVIGTYEGSAWKTLFSKLYHPKGLEGFEYVEDWLRWLKLYDVVAVGTNTQPVLDDALARALTDTVIPVHLKLDGAAPRRQWNFTARSWVGNRTTLFGEYFMDVKRKRAVFPNWDIEQPFFEDLLSMYVGYHPTRGMSYECLPGRGTTVYATVQARLAAEIALNLKPDPAPHFAGKTPTSAPR